MKKNILFFIFTFLGTIAGDTEFDYEDLEVQSSAAGKFLNTTLSDHIPFVASLRLKALDSPWGNGHICGAVFITRQHLLTAAVCVIRINKDYSAEELVVVAGSRNRYEEVNAHKFDVSRIIPRSEYLRFPVMGMDGNLAILELTEPVPDVIDTVSTIEYTRSPVGVDAMCTFYGWGKSRAVDGAKQLQKGNIQILDRTQCVIDWMRHFCAGPSHIGGCPGDDGGPVVCDGILYGLVGWRYDDYCTEFNRAHLYVDISPYHEWIEKLTSGSTTVVLSSTLLIVLVLLGRL